ncbi:MAG: nucleotidyltransferase domain-containing protein [Bacteroidales bacterium]
MTAKTKNILRKTKEKLVRRFGEDIRDVILFGSRAEGNYSVSSDYDMLIVLKNNYDWKYKNEIFDTIFEIEYQYDLIMDVHIVTEHELKHSLRGAHPLFQNAISNGIHA